jgi:hypothetical protein
MHLLHIVHGSLVGMLTCAYTKPVQILLFINHVPGPTCFAGQSVKQDCKELIDQRLCPVYVVTG